MVKYLNFYNSSSFALRYFFNVNGKTLILGEALVGEHANFFPYTIFFLNYDYYDYYKFMIIIIFLISYYYEI